MLGYPADSDVPYRMMAEANVFPGTNRRQGEIHAQFSLNLEPCACNCLFCSFAKANGIFKQKARITQKRPWHPPATGRRRRQCGFYHDHRRNTPFGKFIEISQEVKNNLKPETTLIANVAINRRAMQSQIKDAGFDGVYHALRLRKASIPPSIRNAAEKASVIFRKPG
jgi:biotin synthase